jgi:hypothetical protein
LEQLPEVLPMQTFTGQRSGMGNVGQPGTVDKQAGKRTLGGGEVTREQGVVDIPQMAVGFPGAIPLVRARAGGWHAKLRLMVSEWPNNLYRLVCGSL